ncbi:uncharacterized protein CLUP02_00414 [Colletotrichum lupini]|uniref:Uncharacterized protein n=1 Tax=Colletotrichum lupini TaxID=145971 RepID=A0A9Q8SB13_9PEZI|nr:uncharacterized protein CLUP02_00414 [Colletotrichum lupini]UQC73768.1 hypothetical protein CLUP02_00414 [Colletotrichum lupini]
MSTVSFCENWYSVHKTKKCDGSVTIYEIIEHAGHPPGSTSRRRNFTMAADSRGSILSAQGLAGIKRRPKTAESIVSCHSE